MSVSRSAYYVWLERPQTATEKDDVELVEVIKPLFKKSQKNHGTRCLKKALIKQDRQVSRRRIGRLMNRRLTMNCSTKLLNRASGNVLTHHYGMLIPTRHSKHLETLEMDLDAADDENKDATTHKLLRVRPMARAPSCLDESWRMARFRLWSPSDFSPRLATANSKRKPAPSLLVAVIVVNWHSLRLPTDSPEPVARTSKVEFR